MCVRLSITPKKMLFNQQQRSLQSANSGLSLKKKRLKIMRNAQRNYSTQMSADLSPIDKKQNAKLKGDLNESLINHTTTISTVSIYICSF